MRGRLRCTMTENSALSPSASLEKAGIETYRTAVPTIPGTQLEMLNASR